MPESNLFTDPATDVYPTETPWGPVMAIFDTDPEKPGVRFDPPDGPAVHYMREVIEGAIGHHGIGFTLDTLGQDDYVDFCQPEGVTIEQPWYLRAEAPAVALDYALPDKIEDARSQTDLDPTENQKQSGNYAKGTVKLRDMTVKIEQPRGSVRSGKDADGHEWQQSLAHDYGYLLGMPGADGDPLDVFLGPDYDSEHVFVIEQVDKDGFFDEHKIMLFFSTPENAKHGYLDCYEPGWRGFGSMREMSAEEFSDWSRTLHSPTTALDDAAPPADLDRLRAQLRETSGALARLAVARAILAAREAPEQTTLPTPRRPTAEFYSHDDKRTKGRRQAANDAAVALLRRVQSGDLPRENLTDADREVLAAYSGNGGALTSADGTIGSDYEYYTPSALAAGAWDLLAEMGFAGGKILDPCAGTGVFGATAPANAVVDAVELSEVSGQINALVNDGAGYHTTVAPFERVAAATDDETYDAVVTNVPFSRDVDARGGNQFEDTRYRREPMENYFILRSLEKLKPGGLAAFIVPPRCVSGLDAKQMRLRRSASLMAEFLGAYRLPNHVFGNADADTIVDLMVFRKFARATATKVTELFEQSPATLADANVMWEPFLSGKYFQGEGKRFVLGEFVPKDPTKFRDVDRVTNPASVPELAKMLKRFGGSRIDWAAMNATETAPITYREGDTLYQAGQLLELRNGVWEPRAPSDGDRTNEQRLARMATAMRAFDSGATAADGAALMDYFTRSGQALDAPDWLRRLVRDTAAAPDAQRETLWRVGLIGSAVTEALNHHAGNPRDVLAEIYPDLTAAMQRMRAEAAKLRGAFNAARDAVSNLLAHARAKKALSPRWLGEVLEEVAPAVVDTPSGRIDALLYHAPDAWLAVEDVAAALGAVFDPIADPAWCVSSDGKSVMRADDYYVGSYREFLDRVERELARATDPQVRDKILAQKHAALDRLPRIDPRKISYNLHSPYVTDEERIAFLRQFVHPGFSLDEDAQGKTTYKLEMPANQVTDKIKLLRRLGHYIKEGTVTLANINVGMTDAEALSYLREQAAIIDAQFELWARSNHAIQERLNAVVNDPANLRFRPANDEEAMSIPGMNPDMPPLHKYQNAFVRRMGRDFSGINGHGVGLGKTFGALAAVQHVQALGIKKKTLFVVPASVLSNWQKEARRAYASLDSCMFVGLREDEKTGKFKRVPAAVDEDLTDILANRHDKIFMTFEAFEKIRLRDETIEEYLSYLGSVDSSYDAQQAKAGAAERAKSRAAKVAEGLAKKSGGAPYFEDLGVDSVVIDEAHCFPAGTLVDGTPIEQLKVGDFVRSFNHETGAIELRMVTDTMRRRPDGLARVVLTNGQSIVCTPDHPFFVPSKGYVDAEFLNSGYTVAVNHSKTDLRHAVQSVREELRAELSPAAQGGKRPSSGSILLDDVCGSGEERQGASQACGENSHLLSVRGELLSFAESGEKIREWRDCFLLKPMPFGEEDNGCSDFQGMRAVRDCVRAESHAELEVCDREGGSILLHEDVRSEVETHSLGRDEGVTYKRGEEGEAQARAPGSQLAANPGGCGEKPANATCSRIKQGEEVCGSGRKREGNNGPPADACGCPEVGDRACRADENDARCGGSVSLQTGPGAPRAEDCRRSGRQFAQLLQSEGVRREEGCLFDFVGVDRVEILESTGDGRFGGLCPDGYVYDITVDGNHNFFAAGILVHNCFKNSAALNSFKGAKYLSTAEPSARGLDAMAKSWYVRKDALGNDGVMLLTATPISNSPLEVYSVLALAAGHERINAAFAGIGGADDFMQAVCQKSQELDTGIDGKEKMRDVFVGLSNLEFMQAALHDIATIEDAQSVGAQIIVPERDEQATSVALDDTAKALLNEYKLAYRAAKKVLKKEKPDPDETGALEAVMEKTGEPVELVGHPFNLINKMTMLIADPELDGRATFYNFRPEQRALAEQAAREIGRRNIKEDREKRSAYTPPDRVSVKIKKDGDEKAQIDVVLVSARLLGEDRIVLDSINPETQLKFEAYAAKIGLDLDVTIPAKLAALLENVRREAAQPRGLDGEGKPSPIVKQIVFCDILPMLAKIKRALSKHAGIPAAKIAIITGKVNGNPDEIIDVQNKFNAHGEDNGYECIIANKKAEVGINLQHGTQAIHHLTIGWTPDSIEQRNGRGARQGNRTVKVAIYHYDADGTFDTAKRNLVNVKSDWIDSVVKQGAGSVAITGGLSRDEMDALIESSGESAEAQARVQAGLDAKNRETRIRATRQAQFVSLATIQTMTKTLAGLTDAKRIEKEVLGYIKALRSVTDYRDRMAERADNPSQALIRGLAAAETKAKNIAQRLDASIAVAQGVETTASGVVGATMAELSHVADPALLRYSIEKLAGLIPDNPVALDLVTERDLAQGMIDASRDKIVEMADREGAYPADSADKMANNQAIIAGTALYAVGDFLAGVSTSGGALLVQEVTVDHHGGRNYLSGLLFDAENLGRKVLYEDDLMRGVTSAPRGTPEHETLLDMAAALEDSLQARGFVEQSGMLSAIEPKIAARRKTATLVGHALRDTRLPAPYFPYVITMAAVGNSGELSGLLLELFESQKAIVKSFKEEPYRDIDTFYTDADAPVVAGSDNYEAGFNLALFDQARARGLKWGYVATGRYDSGHSVVVKEIVAGLDWSALSGFIARQTPATREDLEALDEAIRARVTATLEPIMASYEFRAFQSSVVVALLDYLSADVAKTYNEVTAAAVEAVMLRKRAEEAERNEAERVRIEAERAAARERNKVWVVMLSGWGLTKVLNVREFSTKKGEPAAWVPRGKPINRNDVDTAKNRPDAPESSWVIKRTVYDALWEEHGHACRANAVKLFGE